MEINQEGLENRPVIIVNCPIQQYSEYIVAASSTSPQGNDSFFSLYILNNTSIKEPIKLLTQIPINVKFTAIDWTPLGQETEEHALGFVIGGHPDGSISLWDVTKILQSAGESQSNNFGCISNQQLFQSSINVISMNIKPNLFAVGTDQISVLSIDKNFNCSVAMSCQPPNEGGEFCSLNWNEKVNHILATSTNTGNTYIYDMKRKSLFLTIYNQSLAGEGESRPNGPLNTQIVWNVDGAQIIIAYDDPEYNYLTQYHMKQPKAPSAMFQNGHTTSIISLAKNYYDKNYLLTLGRDNRVTAWNIKSKKPIYKVQIKQKSCQVIWSNKLKDCFIYVGYDQKLYFDRINFTEDLSSFTEGEGVIPNWMLPSAGISFSFGSKLYQFAKNSKEIKIFKLNGHEELIKKIKDFTEKIEKPDLLEYLEEKITENRNNKNPNIFLFWSALKSIYNKDMDLLYKDMGYDINEMSEDIERALGHKLKKEKVIEYQPENIETDEDINNIFEKNNEPSSVRTNIINQELLEQPNTITEKITKNINWNVGIEKIIKKSLLIGEISSAVELLFKNGRESEALLIASFQPDVFEKAKETYFRNNKDLFVKSIFPAIINHSFDNLFDYNVVKEWKDYLYYSKTFLKGENEFENFAEKLGDKLSTNPDIFCSIICYILSGNFYKIIDLLYNNYLKESENKENVEKSNLLQTLFEYTLSLNKILNTGNNYNENLILIFYEYSKLLVEEGLYAEACRYLSNLINLNDSKINEIYDRIYNHFEEKIEKNLPRPINNYNLIILHNKSSQIGGLGNKNYNYSNNLTHQFRDNKPPINTISNQNNKKNVPPSNNVLNNRLTTNNPPPSHMNPQPRHMQPNLRPHIPNPVINKPLKQPPLPKNIPNPSNNFSGMDNNNPMSPEKINEQEKNNMNQFNFGVNKDVRTTTKPPAFKPVHPPMRTANPPSLSNTHQMQQNISQNNNQMMNNVPTSNIPNNNNIPNNKMLNSGPFTGNVPNQQNVVNQPQIVPMNQDEQSIHDYFENVVNIYNSVYTDENKQKDFGSKIEVLLKKLENHELKNNVIKLLIEFMPAFDKNDKNSLKKLYMRIQSCDWDKNKSWMPLLERLMNMKRS